MESTTKVKRESKNKIRVDFERTPLLQRLKAKFLNWYFFQRVAWSVVRFVLLVGISYIVLFPFFAKVAGSFMSPEDFLDSTVKIVPKYPTLNIYKAIWVENEYMKGFINTALLSLACAVLQMFICALVGYGFAKFKFKGSGIFFLIMIFTMIVPHQTLQLSFFMKFRFFDIYGIIGFISKLINPENPVSINLINSKWFAPLIILSATGLAFKNGLYVFIYRQFFKGFPDELEEAAYVDGAGVFQTFFRIIIPSSIPMMITIFLFAFSWQWTDDFYTKLFFTDSGVYLLRDIIKPPRSLTTTDAAILASNMYTSAINNTAGLMIIIPLILIYLVGQNFLVQGIERSGITG